MWMSFADSLVIFSQVLLLSYILVCSYFFSLYMCVLPFGVITNNNKNIV